MTVFYEVKSNYVFWVLNTCDTREQFPEWMQTNWYYVHPEV